MSKATIDFQKIEPHHQQVDIRLRNWAAWVQPRTTYGAVSPMFRLYRSKAWQWHAPQYRETCDPLDARQVEGVMRHLPFAHREALIWAYIVRCTPAIACRHLATNYGGLHQLVRDGRQMVVNLTRGVEA